MHKRVQFLMSLCLSLATAEGASRLAPHGAQHPDTRGARLPLSFTRRGCGFEYDGFSFSLMGN